MLYNLVSTYPVLYVALSVVVVLAAQKLEERSKFIRLVSVPVVVIFLGCLCTTLHVTPSYLPVYDAYFKYLMPIAAALFVLKFDVVWLIKHGKRITGMFLLTSGSTFFFVTLIGRCFNFPGKATITGGIVAEYIGGPQNMLAVIDAIGLEESIFSRFIFSDNVWAIFAMMIVFLLPSLKFVSSKFICLYDQKENLNEEEKRESGSADEEMAAVTSMNDHLSLWSVFTIISIGLLILALITPFCAWADASIQNTLMRQLMSTPLIVAPFFALIIATIFRKLLLKMKGEDTFAYFGYLITLFTVGSYTNFFDVLNVEFSMFLLLFIALAVNIGFSMLFAKIFKIPYEEMCLSVAASYAGPGEAYVVAKNNNWNNHAKLGIMIGLLGYVIGGPLGLLAASVLG